MANRTMQSKALKLQRQLRKLPRRIEDPPGEFIRHSGTAIPARLLAEGLSVPRTPNRAVMDMYKTSANSLKTEDWEGKFKGVTPKRLGVCAKIDAILSEVRDIVGESMPSFTIVHTQVRRARVFFNPTKTQWIILEENYIQGIVRRSMVYGDKIRLIDDYKKRVSRLVWVEHRLLNHTEGG